MLRNLLAKYGLISSRTASTECARVQSRLFAYLDHDLPEAENVLIDRHVERCLVCSAELTAIRHADGALSSATALIPSPGDLRAGFYAKLEQSRRKRARVPAWTRTAGALAGTILVGVIASRIALVPHRASSMRPASLVAGVRHGNGAVALARVDPGSTSARNDRIPVRGAGALDTDRKAHLTLALGPSVSRISSARRRYNRSAGPSISHRRVEGSLLAAPAIGGLETYAAARKQRWNLQTGAVSSRLWAAVVPGDSIAVDVPASGSHGRGSLVLAGAYNETELHVSDDDRDFMSSSHVEERSSPHDKSPAVRVEDDNGTPAEPVELPALP